MLRLVYGRDAEICEWVRSHLPWEDDGFGSAMAIGIERDGKIIAGAVYSDFCGTNKEMSIAAESPHWCHKRILRALFEYPFLQLGCPRLTATVPVGNDASLRLCRGLGFEVEGYHPALFPDGVAGWSLGMLRERCRWIGGNHG
jgi:RimJ/RimL family protein N-acetyltransferase